MQFLPTSGRVTTRKVALVAGITAGLLGSVTAGLLAGVGVAPSAAAGRPTDGHPAAIATIPTRTKRMTRTTPTDIQRTPVVTHTIRPRVAVVVRPPARIFVSGSSQLDALLVTLPPVLFEAGANVHFGYNPIDCCHAGGYNPGPNDVWVSERALGSTAKLTYVTVHELAHSLHLHSALGESLTAAVTGAPVVRPGSQWDVSEKVADCVAWALSPAQTAASGITYWNCPEPWRSRVRAALQ